MNVYAAVLAEMTLRLETAMTNGGRLEKHQITALFIQVGDTAEANTEITLPRIVIRDVVINGEAAYSALRDEDKLSFVIEALTPAIHGPNTLYDAETGLGAMQLYADIVDTLERRTSDALDVSLNGTVQGRFSHDGIFDTQPGNFVRLQIPFSATLQKFTVGSRAY